MMDLITDMTNILLIIVVMLLGYIVFRLTIRSFRIIYIERGIKIGTEGSMKALIEEAKKGKPFKLVRNQEVIWLKQVKKDEPIS